MSEPILKAEHITMAYDDVPVISDISLHLNSRELVSLVGTSGVGKTTLFHVLSGVNMPDSGRVILEGEDITGKAGKVSYMLQKDLLFPQKTVLDNVALPLVIKGMKKKEARDKAAAYFQVFGLAGCEKKYPSQMSGGMRQRAALLRTYLFSEKVLLLDEPFSALDAITKTEIHGWYLDIAERMKLTTLFITHDIEEAVKLSDRVYLMTGSPGAITAEIPICAVKPRDAHFDTTEKFLEYKRQLIELLKI